LPSTTPWTRRTFVQTVGSLAAVAGMPQWASASGTNDARSRFKAKFAFVASAKNGISVFSISHNGGWTHAQTVSSPSPAALALSPDKRFLYVANALNTFQHRPTASIEAYAIDNETGHLTVLNRQPLAIHATMPRNLAVSSNGRLLAVAVEGGGVYNLLPLGENGELHPVTASLKLIGQNGKQTSSQRTQPQSVFFRDNKTLIALDRGRNSIFSLSIDTSFALSLDKFEIPFPVDAPTAFIPYPSSGIYFTASAAAPVITSILPDPEASGRFRAAQIFRLPSIDSGFNSLAIHPVATQLFAATSEGISSIEIDPTGWLHAPRYVAHGFGPVDSLHGSPDGVHLFAATKSGSLLRIDMEQGFGPRSTIHEIAGIAGVTAVAFRYS
jgi:6-phosphogluconolactonase